MSREAAIIITLVVYKLGLIALGLVAQRRTRSEEDFFLGGRRLGPWVAALSASASSSSAWTLLGVSGAAYAWGLSSIWLIPACVGGFALNWFVLAPPLHRLSHASGALTTTELLAGPRERPLSGVIAVVASLIILFCLTAYVASQFQGAGKTFHETFGLGLSSSILVGSAIVVFYTLLGGFWAVSLTDTLQGFVMALTAIFLPTAALVAVGGPFALFSSLSSVKVAGYASFFGPRSALLALTFVIAILSIGLGYPGQPHVVNRFMALREDPRALRRARLIAMVWASIVYVGMFFLGLCGRVLVSSLGDKEVIFIAMANKLFPSVVAGVMIAAVLSAIMSTADSQLLVAASALAHDMSPSRGDEKSLILRSRLVILALSALAIGLAIYGSKEIFSSVLFAWSAMGNAFGPLLLVRVLRGPVSPPKTLLAMLAGFLLSVLFYSWSATKGGIFERTFPFVVSGIIALWPSSGDGEKTHAGER